MQKQKSHLPWSSVVATLSIVGLVAFALWFTKSLWAFLGFLGLLFLYKETTINTQCPKCNHEFVAVEQSEEEE